MQVYLQTPSPMKVSTEGYRLVDGLVLPLSCFAHILPLSCCCAGSFVQQTTNHAGSLYILHNYSSRLSLLCTAEEWGWIATFII